jgi:NADPH-dependent glutamate synthase beta subunit-like oxidoreductase
MEEQSKPGVRHQPEQRSETPPCGASCPGGADVRSWIGTIAQRKKLGLRDEEAYRLAWNTIVDVNPFPAIMGRVCPHPCEGGCNRIEKDEAVSVNQMERFLGDWALRAGLPLARLEGDCKAESIGVIGSGPAGLSFAYQMARRGYPVVVYERNAKAGGMLRYGIPVYRLPEAVLDAEIQRILDLGVELKLESRIGRDVSLEQLESRHAMVFLGIGAQHGRMLGLPGETGPGCWSGTDYLSRVNQGDRVALGRRVAVIGGGNTAVDAAREARRGGAEEVLLLYRRTRAEMPAIATEIDEAIEEGVRIEFLVAPTEIVRDGDRLDSLVLTRMELGPADASGRRRPLPIAGSEYSLSVDSLIAAVSQQTDWSGLEAYRFDEDASPAEEFGKSAAHVWAGGDVIGLGVAGSAIGSGRLAAESMHARLRGLPEPVHSEADPITIGSVRLDHHPEQPRSEPLALPVSEWLQEPDAEIHLGISEEQFLAEAARCLSCGQCFGCEQCWMYCPHTCFTRLENVQPGMYYALNLDQCQACGKCIDICPCGFLHVQSQADPA